MAKRRQLLTSSSSNAVFRLKQTPNIKRFIAQKMMEAEWVNAGQGWQGIEGSLQLLGWEKARRVIILRRKIKKDIGVVHQNAITGQTVFQFADMGEDIKAYEYAALVANLNDEIMSLSQHYRDRADSENNVSPSKIRA